MIHIKVEMSNPSKKSKRPL